MQRPWGDIFKKKKKIEGAGLVGTGMTERKRRRRNLERQAGAAACKFFQ